MLKYSQIIALTAISTLLLPSCAAVKTTGTVAALPFKAAYKTTEFAGKTVWATGKGVYYVGSVPVKIADKALDTSAKILTVTILTLDATGKAITVTRQIKAAQLDMELAAIKHTANIVSVTVDAL